MPFHLTEEQAGVLWGLFKDSARRRYMKPEEFQIVRDIILPNVSEDLKPSVRYYVNVREEFDEWINS